MNKVIVIFGVLSLRSYSYDSRKLICGVYSNELPRGRAIEVSETRPLRYENQETRLNFFVLALDSWFFNQSNASPESDPRGILLIKNLELKRVVPSSLVYPSCFLRYYFESSLSSCLTCRWRYLRILMYRNASPFA